MVEQMQIDKVRQLCGIYNIAGHLVAVTVSKDEKANEAGQVTLDRRIVAVINGCLGISTEALEDGAVGKLVKVLKKATHELNAIRARDGAPQHIDWHRGRPMQTDSCTHEAWDALTEECFAALAAVEGLRDAEDFGDA